MAWLGSTAEEHFNTLKGLIRKERETDLQLQQQRIAGEDIKSRVASGITWYPLIVKEDYYDQREYVVVEFERTKETDQPNSFSYGAHVEIFSQHSSFQKGNEIKGVIGTVSFKHIQVFTKCNELPDWFDNGKLGINLLLDDYSYKVMDETIDQVRNAKGNRLAQLRDVILGDKEPTVSKEIIELDRSDLNEDQYKSAVNALQANEYSVIQGPPGTGKTTTIVAMVKALHKTEQQVLVVAPSNQAVDHLAVKLHLQGLNVVRLGQPHRLSAEVRPLSLLEQLYNHNDYKLVKELKARGNTMKSMAFKYKRSFGREEREQQKLLRKEATSLYKASEAQERQISDIILDKADVICCTLVGANLPVLKDRFFKTAIVDEAAQALEASTWIPIARSQKVILCGDHFQLPPTVKLDENDGGRELAVTLMERIIGDRVAGNLLTTQYRMHDVIKEFSNKQFYNNKLVTDPVVQQLRTDDEPMVYIDTAGCGFEEELDALTTSTYNAGEINTIEKWLTQARENKHIDKYHSIGIISPYSAQVKRLKERFENIGVMDLKVSTVDSFQGQEADVIIISLVRSNQKGEIGFLNDTRRMNVAMTRAKQKLIMIGDSATLSHSKFYTQFLEYIDSIGAYHSAWEWQE
ncbi:MAG: putative ATPase [Cytophagaceae bacterium]|jgi:superfamily I DNA and/or RNA helicase|nr:putative ATPase [Cytophagaceae bacterium]